MAELGKKLGKLSLAILENFVEGTLLGEKFVDELRAPTDREVAIATAPGETEDIFVSTFDDKELSKALFVDLSQKDRPSLKEAVEKYFDHPTDPSLRQELQKILFDEFKDILSKERIDKAVDFYLRLLTKELMLADEGFRDSIAALAIYEGNLSEQRSVELLEKIAEQIVQQQAFTQQVFRSIYQLPPSPADFIGREVLITQLLSDFNSHAGATISGLTGMGGIGKTALGLVIANQLTEKYRDAQIFLDLKGTTAPLSAVDIARHVILSFEPTADLRTLDETNMQAAYQSVLHGRRALLFFDNARSAEQIAALRPPATCALLVISRWTFSVSGLQPRRVDVMAEGDAQKFLLELCPRVNDKAAELAKACAYLPLALRIAGSFLKVNSNRKVDQYLEELKNAKGRLTTLAKSRAGAELTTEPDVLATFELSYNQLKADEQKNWRALGVFPASFTGNATAAIWEMEESDAETLLALFMRYSLIDYNETAARYELHDLLAEYARSRMESGEEQEARLKHASHYKGVLSAADDLYLEGGDKIMLGLRLFDIEWEHIRTGQAWAAAMKNINADSSRLCIDYPDAGVYVLSLRQHPKEKIRWLEVAVSAAHEIGDRNGEGAALGNLGIAYADLGEARKAIEFYEQALVIDREIGDRRGEGNTLFNMGLALHDLDEKEKSIALVWQALKFYEAIESPHAESTRNQLKEWGALE